MRRNIENVINAFLAVHHHTERCCSTDGKVLKSYLMPIAYREPKTGVILLVNESESPSRTTDLHIRAINFTCAIIKIPCQRVTGRQLQEARDNAA